MFFVCSSLELTNSREMARSKKEFKSRYVKMQSVKRSKIPYSATKHNSIEGIIKKFKKLNTKSKRLDMKVARKNKKRDDGNTDTTIATNKATSTIFSSKTDGVCFSITVKEYLTKMKASYEIVNSNCQLTSSNESLAKLFSLAEKIADFQVKSSFRPSEITNEYVNTINLGDYSPSLQTALNNLIEIKNYSSLDFNNVNAAINAEIESVVNAFEYSDAFLLRGINLILNYKRQITQIENVLSYTTDSENSCMPSSWTILPTFDSKDQYLNFTWHSKDCKEANGSIPINLDSEEQSQTISFWYRENIMELINKGKSSGSTFGETLSTSFQEASKIVVYEFTRNNNILHSYYQILNASAIIVNNYNFNNYFDTNADYSELAKDETAYKYNSDAHCKQWNFNVLHLRRGCDYYEISIIQRNPATQNSFLVSFKIKLPNIKGSSLVLNTSNSRISFVKNIVDFDFTTTNIINLMYGNLNQLPSLSLKECLESGTNCRYSGFDGSCLVCPQDKYLKNGECVGDCSTNNYPSTSNLTSSLSTNTCIPCQPTCSTCTGSDTCLTCAANYVLQGDICKTKCDINYFPVTVDGVVVCKTCSENNICGNCSNSTACSGNCANGYYLQNGICVSSCSDGYYLDTEQNKCVNCNNNCATCTSSTVCETCKENYYYNNRSCISSCPENSYTDINNSKCIQCPSECSKCSYSGTQVASISSSDLTCDSCNSGYSLNNGTCTTTCPDGSSSYSGICKQCTVADCKYCIDSPSHCTACKNNFYLKDNKCVTECGDYYIADPNKPNKECVKCQTNNCLTCSDISTCTHCGNNHVLQNKQCLPDCYSGYVSVNGICTACTGNNCLTCHENDLNTCITCKNNFYMINEGSCETCPVNNGYYMKNGDCLPCNNNCALCNNGTCNQCNKGYLLEEKKCVSNCSPGYYQLESECKPCTGRDCLTCSNSHSKCLTCLGNLVLDPISGDCVFECRFGYFVNPNNNTCEQCGSNCIECVDSRTCNVCRDPYALSLNKTCVKPCDEGTILVRNELNNLECKSCSSSLSNCKTCSNLTSCTGCDNGYFLYKNNCVQSCGDGTYEKNNSCYDCSYPCKNCTESSKNCTSCDEPFTYNTETNKCTMNCEEGKIYDESTLSCVNCADKNCNTCSSLSLNSCISCASGYVRQDNKCVIDCFTGYYANNKNICVNCDPNCLSCSNSATNCTTCPSSKALYNNKCEDNCAPGTVLITSDSSPGSNPDTNECVDCGNNCLECSHEKPSENCITCKQNYVLNNNTCDTSCNKGYVAINGKCEQCQVENCDECANSTNTCTHCKDDFLLSVDKKKCLQYCEINSKPIRELNKCVPCKTLNCKICDVDENICNECSSDYSLNLIENKCENPCRSGYYMTMSEGGNSVTNNFNNQAYYNAYNNGSLIPNSYSVCKPCPDSCMTCSYSELNGVTCDSCIGNYVLLNGDCRTSCSQHYVANTQTKKCEQCSDIVNCNRCSLNNKNDCIECVDGTYLQNKRCVTQCDSDKMANSNNECVSCATHCSECLTSDTCKTCEVGYELINGKCLSSCSSGQVRIATGECKDCVDKNNCVECNAANTSICFSCKYPKVLYNGRCVEDCYETTYKSYNSSTGIEECLPCPSKCKVCTNSSSCTECKTNYSLIPINSSNSNSYCDVCPTGTFDNKGICNPCADGCSNCNNFDSCLNCNSGYYNYYGVCKPTCPDGSYLIASENSCINCADKNCSSCSTSEDCISCKSNYYLSNNICVSDSCPPSTTLVSSNPNICANCAINCEVCSTSDPNNCISCEESSYLISYPEAPTVSSCISNCPFGYYENQTNKRCEKCSSNCKTCINNDFCEACYSNFYLITNQLDGKTHCDSICPLGQYPTTNGTCNSCSDNCSKCTNINICNVCNSDYALFKGTCVSSCEDGYVMQNVSSSQNNKTCVACNSTCATCSEEPNHCDSCLDSSLSVSYGACVTNCPLNTVSIQGKCVNCSDSTNCLVCSSQDTSKCNQCSNNTVLRNDKTCNTTCEDGFHKVLRTDGYYYCEQCNVTECKTCSSSDTCSECNPTFFLVNNSSCSTTCPSNFVPVNGDNKHCVKCETNEYCDKCDTQNKSHCTSCIEGYKYDPSTFSCVESCPTKTYVKTISEDPLVQNCTSCSSNCTQCSDSNICDVCENNYYKKNNECTNTCGEGYYPSTDIANPNIKYCNSCSSDCNSCINSETCTQCKANFYLSKGQCVSSCPPGSVISSSNDSCINCKQPAACNSCSNVDGSCLPNHCNSGYYYYNGTCYENCPLETTADVSTSTCIPCSVANCSKCNGGINTCESCTSGFVMKTQNPDKTFTYSCTQNCDLDHYYDGEYCLSCVAPCKKCSSANTCIDCIDSYVLYNSYCFTNCESGFVDVNGKCEACGENCNICSSTNEKSCLSCKAGFVNFNGICKEKCDDGYFKSKEDNLCEPCMTGCSKCSNSEECDECVNLKKNKHCVNTCGDHFVADGKECVPCDSDSCSECEVSSTTNNANNENNNDNGNNQSSQNISINKKRKNTQYKTKKSSFVEYEVEYEIEKDSKSLKIKSFDYSKFTRNFAIYDKKYGKQRLNSSSIMLYDNNSKSLRLSNQQDSNIVCLICNNNSYLENGVCVPSCSEGYYLNSTQTRCISCGIENCNKCTIYNESPSCTACDSSHYLENGKCVSKCSEGYGLIGSTCTSCTYSDCYNCASSLNRCLTCKTPKKLINGLCLTSCPSGYTSVYKDGFYYCVSCPNDCNNCSVVYNSSTKQYDLVSGTCSCTSPKVVKNDYCVDPTCNPGTVLTSSGCVACPTANCDSCSSSNYECTSCKNTYFLYNNKCYGSCPSGTYADGKYCKNCPDHCKNCSQSNSCTTCDTNYYLTATKECSTCDYSNSVVIVGNECKTCSSNCEKCVPGYENICKTCPSGLFLKQGTCVTTCGTGFYPENHNCVSCDESCNTCSNSHSCDSCYGNLVLKNGFCVSLCGEGFYSHNGICVSCSANCKTCNGSGCTECYNSSNMTNTSNTTPNNSGSPIDYALYNGQCTPTCSSGTIKYTNPNTGIISCKSCSELYGTYCLSCDSSTCLTCSDSKVISNKTCKDNCDEGYYKSNGNCITCSIQGCTSCSNANSCDSCSSDKIFFNGNCVDQCSSGYFETTNNNIKTCSSCTNNCSTCKNSDECLICNSGFYMNTDKKCVSSCTGNTTSVGNTCITCTDENCLSCEAENPSSCTSCSSNKYLKNGSCKDYCGDNFYSENNTCYECDGSCMTCSSFATCTSCNNGYTLNSQTNECEPGCSENKFLLDGKCVCCADPRCKYCSDKATCIQCEDGYSIFKGKCIEECPNGYFTSQSALTSQTAGNSVGISGTDSAGHSGSLDFRLNSHNSNDTSNIKRQKSRRSVAFEKRRKYKTLSMLRTTTNVFGNSSISKTRKSRYTAFKSKDTAYVKKCIQCKSHCSVCSSSTSCAKCSNGYYLNANGECALTCQTGYYANCNTRTCDACSENCASCPSSSNQCESCKANFILLPNLPGSASLDKLGKCYSPSEIPSGYYIDTTTQTFIQCNVYNCASCSNSFTCNTCETGFTLSDDKSRCTSEKQFVRILTDSKVYDNTTNGVLGKLKSLPNFNNLLNSCGSSFRSFGFAMYFRLITDHNSSNTKRRISNKADTTYYNIFSFNQANTDSDNSSSKLGLALKLDQNGCLVFDYNTNKINETLVTKTCSFNELKHWNVIAINADKISAGIQIYLTFYDLESKFPKTYSAIIPNTENTELNLLSPDAMLSINSENTNKSINVFELGNLRLIKHIPSDSDFTDDIIPEGIKCDDVNCKTCSNYKPYICSNCFVNATRKFIKNNNREITLRSEEKQTNMSCSAVFISLTKMFDSPKETIESINSNSNRISTRVYNFEGLIYIKENNLGYDLLNLNYAYNNKQLNILKIELTEESKISITVGKNPSSTVDNILPISKWHYINVTVDGNTNSAEVIVLLEAINGEQYMQNRFIKSFEYTQEVYTLSDKTIIETISTNNAIAKRDFRLNLNKPAMNDYVFKVFPENCQSVNGSFVCQSCNRGFILNSSNSCISETSANWTYDNYDLVKNVVSAFDSEPLTLPYNFADNLRSKRVSKASNIVRSFPISSLANNFSLQFYIRRGAFGFNKLTTEEPLVYLKVSTPESEDFSFTPIIYQSTDPEFSSTIYTLDLSRFVTSGSTEASSTKYTIKYSNYSFDYLVVIFTVSLKEGELNPKINIQLYDYQNSTSSNKLSVTASSSTMIYNELKIFSAKTKFTPTEIGPIYTYSTAIDLSKISSAPKPTIPNLSCRDYDYKNKFCKNCGENSTNDNLENCPIAKLGSFDVSIKKSAIKSGIKNDSLESPYAYTLPTAFTNIGGQSSKFAITGWFNINDFLSQQDLKKCDNNCTALLFRLSNYDVKNEVVEKSGLTINNEGDNGYNYDLDILALQLKYENDSFIPQIIVSAFPKTNTFVLDVNSKLSKDYWYNFYLAIDLENKKLVFDIYDSYGTQKGERTEHDFSESSGKFTSLQSFSTLKFFGVDSYKYDHYTENVVGEVRKIGIIANSSEVEASYFPDKNKVHRDYSSKDKKSRTQGNEVNNQSNQNENKLSAQKLITLRPNYFFSHDEFTNDGSNINSTIEGLASADTLNSITYSAISSEQSTLTSFNINFWLRRNYYSNNIIKKPFFEFGNLKIFLDNDSLIKSVKLITDLSFSFNLPTITQDQFSWVSVQIYADLKTKTGTVALRSILTPQASTYNEFTFDENCFVSLSNSKSVTVFNHNGEIGIQRINFIPNPESKYVNLDILENPVPNITDNDSVYKIGNSLCENASVDSIINISENISSNKENKYLQLLKDFNYISNKKNKCSFRLIDIDNISGIRAISSDSNSNDNSISIQKTNKMLVSDYLTTFNKDIRFKTLFMRFQSYIPSNYSGSILKIHTHYDSDNELSANNKTNNDDTTCDSCLLSIQYNKGVVSLIYYKIKPLQEKKKVVLSINLNSSEASMHVFALSITQDTVTLKIISKISNFAIDFIDNTLYDTINQTEIEWLTGAAVFNFGKDFINTSLLKATEYPISDIITFESIQIAFEASLSKTQLTSYARDLFNKYSACGTALGKCLFCNNKESLDAVSNVCIKKEFSDVIETVRFENTAIVSNQNKQFSQNLGESSLIAQINFVYRRVFYSRIKEELASMFENNEKTYYYGLFSIGVYRVLENNNKFVIYDPKTNKGIEIYKQNNSNSFNSYSFRIKQDSGNVVFSIFNESNRTNEKLLGKVKFNTLLTDQVKFETLISGKIGDFVYNSAYGTEISNLVVYKFKESSGKTTSDNIAVSKLSKGLPYGNSKRECSKTCLCECKSNFCPMKCRINSSSSFVNLLEAYNSKLSSSKNSSIGRFVNLIDALNIAIVENTGDDYLPTSIFSSSNNTNEAQITSLIDINKFSYGIIINNISLVNTSTTTELLNFAYPSVNKKETYSSDHHIKAESNFLFKVLITPDNKNPSINNIVFKTQSEDIILASYSNSTTISIMRILFSIDNKHSILNSLVLVNNSYNTHTTLIRTQLDSLTSFTAFYVNPNIKNLYFTATTVSMERMITKDLIETTNSRLVLKNNSKYTNNKKNNINLENDAIMKCEEGSVLINNQCITQSQKITASIHLIDDKVYSKTLRTVASSFTKRKRKN